MRIFSIVFILTLTTVGISKRKCPRVCPMLLHPTCGHAKTCNYEGLNACTMDIEICWRKKRELPAFTSIVDGRCPDTEPICPPSDERMTM